jgi:hypothetical protein
MYFSQLFIAAFAATAFAAPFNPWESWRDERSCGEHSFHWDATHGRCLGAALEGGIQHAEWEAWRDERSCREHSFHWDIAHGRCGLKKRDVEDHPGDWHNRHDCEGHSLRWDEAHGRCGLHKREEESTAVTEEYPHGWRHGEWDSYHDRGECERRHFRWDGERCGGIFKREEDTTEATETTEVTEEYPHGWRHGEWDSYHDRGECERRHFRWDGERCGGIFKREEDTTEVTETTDERFPPEWRHGDWDRFNDRHGCEGHSFHWDVEHGRCGFLAKRAEETTSTAEERFPPEGRREFEHRGEFDHRGDFGRHGDWERWNDRGGCEGHSFHWDIEHGRCGL